MKSKRVHQYVFVLLLLAISLFSLTPARADQVQNQLGTIVIHLTGQATSINNATTPSGSATLDLVGGVHYDGNGGLLMQNLTGNLQIGSAIYTISTGHGESNRLGLFVILGESTSGELILHGSIQNNSTMTTDSPPSRLSSLDYLALSGSVSVSNIGNDSGVNVELSSTSTIEKSTNTNTNTNSTREITRYGSSTSSIVNVTSQSEISNNTTTSALTESIANSTSLNQTASNAMPEQNNITVTATRLYNQSITVYVTNTVANYTFTQVTTTTVANITITQPSSSINVSNTTVIVTNSTTSGP